MCNLCRRHVIGYLEDPTRSAKLDARHDNIPITEVFVFVLCWIILRSADVTVFALVLQVYLEGNRLYGPLPKFLADGNRASS